MKKNINYKICKNAFENSNPLSAKENINWKLYNHLGDIYQSSNSLYLLRHGQSESNEKNIIVSDIKHGILKYGLTIQGINEIENSMQNVVLGNKGCEVLLYSSPFLRTIQTASKVSEIFEIKDIYCDVRLRERFFGEFELKEASNYQKVWNEDKINPNHKKWYVESTYEVLERVTSSIREVNTLYSNKNIFFVTHGDVAHIFMCAYLNNNPKTHREVDSIETGELRMFHQAQTTT